MASSPQVEMARFPSGAHARVLLLGETLGDILVVLRGLAGIVPNPLVTCSFLGSGWRPVRKTPEHLSTTPCPSAGS